MEPADAQDLKTWKSHASALYREYNYAQYDGEMLALWYRERNNRSNRYFAIRNEEERCIGFIGLKEIRRVRKISTLGFALDLRETGRGLGTKAMREFLPIYFEALGFRAMELFVYAYNENAVAVYKKLGFELVDMTVDEILSPCNFPSAEELERYPDAFRRMGRGYDFTVYKMRLTAAEFAKGDRHAFPAGRLEN